MKLNPIKPRPVDKPYWTSDHIAEYDAAIKKANAEGIGYDVVRHLQQVRPWFVPWSDTVTYKQAIERHIAEWQGCTKCRLGQCPFVVNKCFFRGYIPCEVLFVGEAPGFNEDTHARPFIGEAGRVLDEMIKETSRRLSPQPAVLDDKWYARDNAFKWCITNTVLCLPYDQGDFREPLADEIATCLPRLMKFIQIAEPHLIVTMGLHANRALRSFNAVPKLHINHPSWFNRIKQTVERETQVKKAVLDLVASIHEHVGDQ